MTITVEGIYSKGRIQLLEEPSGIREGRVSVTLSDAESWQSEPRYLTPGKYNTGRMSSLEDFKDAEWHGEHEFNGE